jgi:N-methylhydantoinase B/oxoprolinase/acetone carboxylase alpha subunit
MASRCRQRATINSDITVFLKAADAGGGGCAEPRLRDRRRIAAHLAERFVTLEGARRDNGFDG